MWPEERLESLLASAKLEAPEVGAVNDEVALRTNDFLCEKAREINPSRAECLICKKHFKNLGYVHKHLRKARALGVCRGRLGLRVRRGSNLGTGAGPKPEGARISISPDSASRGSELDEHRCFRLGFGCGAELSRLGACTPSPGRPGPGAMRPVRFHDDVRRRLGAAAM